MVRINLLPREILDRRKYEKWYGWVFLAGALLFVVIAVLWLALSTLANTKSAELQQSQESVSQLKASADAFAIFEQQQEAAQARVAVANAALAGRLDMGKIAEEISLILPSEMWVNSIHLDQTTGLDLKGYTPSSSKMSSVEGFKSVVGLMVRMNVLSSVTDVWLTSAATAPFNAFDKTALAAAGQSAGLPTVQFEVTGKIVPPVQTDAGASASTIPGK